MSLTADRRSLLVELEGAMNSRDVKERATVLDRITDLFFNLAADSNQVALFDDVFLQLTKQVEIGARAKLARRLADASAALDRIIQVLAQDEAIDVAGPVLARSTHVSETSLIHVAETMSQAHLLAIAGRQRVAVPVSDVLVNRGQVEVLRRISGNLNAEFSETGLDVLATRGCKDGEIAENLIARSDVPPSVYRRLLAQATDAVRARFTDEAGPEQNHFVVQAIEEVSREVSRAIAPEISTEARRCVYEAYEKNQLNEDLLAEFAQSNMFAETAVALAVLSAMPIDTVTAQMLCGRTSGLLVLCKSKDYRWPTAKAVICIGHERSTAEIEQARHEYYALSAQSAARALRFVGARRTLQKSGQPDHAARPIKPEMEVLMTGLEKRSTRDRRSGVDTRSEEERRLVGERRSGVDGCARFRWCRHAIKCGCRGLRCTAPLTTMLQTSILRWEVAKYVPSNACLLIRAHSAAGSVVRCSGRPRA